MLRHMKRDCVSDKNKVKLQCYVSVSVGICNYCDRRGGWDAEAIEHPAALQRREGMSEIAHGRPPHVSVATIINISQYMYIRTALLTRLLEILRQPTAGFCPSWGSSGRRIPRVFVQYTQLPGNITNDRFSWVPGGSSTKPNLFANELGQPGSIPALVLPSGSMAAGHRKGVTTGRKRTGASGFQSMSINPDAY
ncbi:hypothetical protein T265_01696 [Opisthorchis viverrini]|uniref:Uncharacterized protein n=1 Tax=Opisthorchis viverrini TaxID=6198 RepID=A0A074ZYX1_OPIVI|nr:hypothetical protein T265_01696 [Opisthorchis viverrini]KER32271.1 hypothetical protein T265_01696 [Opisthorchis viverrini]